MGLTIVLRKRKNSSEDVEEGELPTNPRELNSSKADLTNTSSALANKNSEENNNECVPRKYLL